MTNTDRNTASTPDPSHTDDRDWKRLSDNILTLALGKSDRMIAEDCIDDAAFDRDARDLRLLMSSAEIAVRMTQQNEKDRRSDEEHSLPKERTEEELDDIFRRVTARVDTFDAEERTRSAGATAPDQRDTPAHDPGRGAEPDPQNRSKQGMADQCA